ncbi:MAG: hypothetical protein UR42_C0001G0027 [Candidatus Roizmanbacteria bacterium GW2011_GWA2_33_33]|uniref:Glycosyltransferase RgtA/B/C/D-like domain-containing protein n=1 Tax=Candidatus Roizmanbacteria bacterium GW2011_GWA2_33_33 TaxID=1618476 RepID=A0A0G0CP81_9BACT|nr:MAG: hypothetical protein UR42_C0001G0027 [Candidatus Roizmanbacteria bacterium GW2011_GWA2_33_33]
MIEKINSKKNFQFSIFNFQSIFKFLILNFKFPIFIALFLLLFYTRFINIGWGLPYPMHPDERNMANAIQTLNCKFSIFNFQFSNLRECFNPHFFAYGQFPLYLGYLIVYFLKFFDGDLGFPIGFQEAVFSLRIISAVASIINAIIIIKIIKVITKKESYLLSLISYLLIIFSPFAIQFAHFGTTESLLMLFYSLIIYLSMLMFKRRTTDAVVWLALVSGLAVATKISSIIFIIVPTVTILSISRPWDRYKNLIKFGALAIIFTMLFSPHNFLNFRDFVNAMNYESDVALGKSLVFYTRQFFNTQPILFQLEKVFPYTLGWPVFILGSLGFLGLSWKDKKINLLRFAFLIYFIPSALIYAKWSRFMTPIFPIITIFAILFLLRIKVINVIKIIIIIIAILPGIAYLQVYQNPDVRFQASDWIYKNIPNNSYILSETANVVDIPVLNPKSEIRNPKQIQNLNYQIISFNFYDLDQSLELQLELSNHLEKADYIFVPSRRIFANHSKKTYPILNQYYEDLFSGKLGFEKVAEFSSGLNDEQAEETWTVFDHPVIRIYKKVK